MLIGAGQDNVDPRASLASGRPDIIQIKNRRLLTAMNDPQCCSTEISGNNAKFIVLPGRGHDISDVYENPELWDWFLQLGETSGEFRFSRMGYLKGAVPDGWMKASGVNQ